MLAPTLLWVRMGLEPHVTVFDLECATKRGLRPQTFRRLAEAVAEAMQRREAERREGFLPWISVGTSDGPALFNPQAVVALAMAFELIAVPTPAQQLHEFKKLCDRLEPDGVEAAQSELAGTIQTASAAGEAITPAAPA